MKWISILGKWGAILAGGLLFFVLFTIAGTILARPLGLNSPVWVVQFNEYALLWLTFLAAPWVLARNKHVRVDLISSRLGEKNRNRLEKALSPLGMIICLIYGGYGMGTALEQMERGVVDIQAVDVPKHLVLWVIPAGFILMALVFGHRGWRDRRRNPRLQERKEKI